MKKSTLQRVWLRFSFGSLPPEMIDRDRLAKKVIIDLVAFDNQRRPHTIHKGTYYKGTVERIAGCGKIKQDFNLNPTLVNLIIEAETTLTVIISIYEALRR